MIFILEAFFSGCISKVINDSKDYSWVKIKSVINDRHDQNISTKICRVIEKSLNIVTDKKFKDTDKLYDAIEKIFNEFKNHGDTLESVKCGLDVLGVDASDQRCENFLEKFYEGIRQDDDLYKVVIWDLEQRGIKLSQEEFRKLNEKIDNLTEIVSSRNDNENDLQKREPVKSRTQEYADKIEINAPNGAQINIVKDNGSVSANVNNGCENAQDQVKKRDIKIKLIHQKWFKYITIILIFVVVFISIYQNFFGRIVYEDGILTPIYYYESMQDYDAKEYAEEFSEERWDYGCMLNIYLSNKKKIPVIVSESSIIIDNIIKEKQPKVYIIGDYSEPDNILSLYAINNGTGKFINGEICIRIKHFKNNEGNYSSEYLNENQISCLTGCDGVIEIGDLFGGEIRKIASYNLNKSFLKELELISISYKIIDKDNDYLIDSDIGLIGYDDYLGIYFSYSEGDFSDTIVGRSLSIDVDDDRGRELKIPTNFVIGENNLINISPLYKFLIKKYRTGLSDV